MQKRVDRASVGAVVDELVVGRPQHRMACARICAVAAAIDQRLRMLDAHADGERLGLDGDAALPQHLKGVARAVADGEHDMIGGDMGAVGEHHAANMAQAVPALLDFDILEPAFETILAAERLDGAAHVLHDGHQPERADVGLGDGQDFRRRAGRDEFGQHLAPVVMGIPDLAVELAVGKQAGAALAELHVGFRVEHGTAPQAPGVLGALAHDLAALQDDRAKPHLRQHQAGKQAARAGADHHRPRGRSRRRAGHEAVVHVGGAREVAVLGEPLEQRRFVRDLDVQRVGQRDRRPLARIGGAAEHGKADEIRAGISAARGRRT